MLLVKYSRIQAKDGDITQIRKLLTRTNYLQTFVPRKNV